MRRLLILLLSGLVLLSCSKDKIERDIKGKWYHTGTITEWEDGTPYTYSSINAIYPYTNTKTEMHVGSLTYSYTVINESSVYCKGDTLTISWDEDKSEGFNLTTPFNEVGKSHTYHYRKDP